ncbi:hypothetical protein [Pyrodictium abyssi]|uniref:Ribbon-helix-helix protein CopG domain-containing protein n=1 Tax=Pyrodictium abyssi TaxID=54256 RepID=A0ABN6ZL93_9CREN|nr:hypothetical protein PABY_05970 [Pyrodictium abyssi]
MTRRGQHVVTVSVPLPRSVVEIARRRGVEPEKLAEAARRLLLLEIIAMESKLSMEEAIELAEEVSRRAWERIKETQQ